MAKHSKSLDDLTLDNGGGVCHKAGDPFSGKLRQEYGANDDAYWVDKAIEAEKGGYAGYEKAIEFLLGKLVLAGLH
ncbi:MAG: hypothetical protein HQK99_17745 [Nitrospirae bacterium]|nr:hypothetical protein [Nitrospirota bacterium]